jgi:hypothetical protein
MYTTCLTVKATPYLSHIVHFLFLMVLGINIYYFPKLLYPGDLCNGDTAVFCEIVTEFLNIV